MEADHNGLKHVYIRTSLGYKDKDDKCAINAVNAHKAGLKVSYYHFAYPSKSSSATVIDDAKNEAGWFCDVIKTLPAFENLVIDCENFSSNTDSTLSKDEYQLWLQTFLDTVKTITGADCIIYTYADYLTRHLPDNHPFGKYKLWIANYSNVAIPKLPKGWNSYYMWQYTDKGTIDGISGNIDCNSFNPALIATI